MEQNTNYKTSEPITFTEAELRVKGYDNPGEHPALDTNVAARQHMIEVNDTSTGPETITVREADISSVVMDGLRLAAANMVVSIDGTTGTVLTPTEAKNVDRGVSTYR
jgi:hypothetical protein